MHPIENRETEQFLELEKYETLGLFDEGILKRYTSADEIKESFKKFLDKNVHYTNFFKDTATYRMFMPYGRKLEIEIRIEYKDSIPKQIVLKDLLFYYKFGSAKFIKLKSGFKEHLESEYKRELKNLKEKYLIKE